MREKNDPLEVLRIEAEAEARVSPSGRRRPTWAPPLMLGDELTNVCVQLGWLKSTDIPAGRLWARFLNPQRTGGKAVCNGFEFRVGTERSGRRFFESWKRADEWHNGPRWFDPEVERHKYDPDSFARAKARYVLLAGSVELAVKRIAEFVGDPDAQMAIAGRATGHCCRCGKGIYDPVSLETGIGSECRSRERQYRPQLIRVAG